MADKLNLDKEKVEEKAVSITSAAAYFTAAELSPSDSRTNIAANSLGKAAFQTEQSSITT